MIMAVSFMFFSLVLVILLFGAFLGLTMKLKYDREKYSVFECGFDLLSNLRLPFSLNFYFITIIFLIFDVELVLILPFIFNFKTIVTGEVIAVMAIFFFVLIVGFIYEWGAGLLSWLI